MTPEQLRDEIARDDATLQEVIQITSRYQRHTVDIKGQAPLYVEDKMLVVERGWRRAKWMWAILSVIVTAFVVIRLCLGSYK